ncbi:MAG: rhodanese-like domain-containing protein [Myxococcota bacterium]
MPPRSSEPPLLVTSDWLQVHADDSRLRLFDCTGHIEFPADQPPIARSGRALYDRGHIPGAAYLDILADLSGVPRGDRFYAPLDPEEFAARAGQLGIGGDVHAVLYCSRRPSWATRVWWLLRLHGFDRISLLGGGWESWVRRGGRVSLDDTVHPAAEFALGYRPRLLADTQYVERMTRDRALGRLVNALSPEQFRGTDSIYYGRPGHIPNSVNLSYTSLLDEGSHSSFRNDERSASMLAAAADTAEHVVAYCGGGVGATALAFAWALAGRADVAVYDGSMIEWAFDPSRPISTELRTGSR